MLAVNETKEPFDSFISSNLNISKPTNVRSKNPVTNCHFHCQLCAVHSKRVKLSTKQDQLFSTKFAINQPLFATLCVDCMLNLFTNLSTGLNSYFKAFHIAESTHYLFTGIASAEGVV